MPGWAVIAVIAAVSVVLFSLAWWSSGRSGPRSLPGTSETEKDYLSRGSWRSEQL